MELDPCTTCTCGVVEKLEEVLKVNEVWKRDYEELLAKFNTVQKELESLKNVEKIDTRTSESKQGDAEVEQTDEVAALRQQLQLYKEDYDELKRELTLRNRQLSETQVKLNKSGDLVNKLHKERRQVEKRRDNAKGEKEYILSELRRLSNAPTKQKNDGVQEVIVELNELSRKKEALLNNHEENKNKADTTTEGSPSDSPQQSPRGHQINPVANWTQVLDLRSNTPHYFPQSCYI